jgi:hypothetical protein
MTEAPTSPPLSQLLDFLARLEAASIHYTLDKVRPDAILVSVAVAGQRWEVEFMVEGTVEIEKFMSDGTIHGEEALGELFDKFSD